MLWLEAASGGQLPGSPRGQLQVNGGRPSGRVGAGQHLGLLPLLLLLLRQLMWWPAPGGPHRTRRISGSAAGSFVVATDSSAAKRRTSSSSSSSHGRSSTGSSSGTRRPRSDLLLLPLQVLLPLQLLHLLLVRVDTAPAQGRPAPAAGGSSSGVPRPPPRRYCHGLLLLLLPLLGIAHDSATATQGGPAPRGLRSRGRRPGRAGTCSTRPLCLCLCLCLGHTLQLQEWYSQAVESVMCHAQSGLILPLLALFLLLLEALSEWARARFALHPPLPPPLPPLLRPLLCLLLEALGKWARAAPPLPLASHPPPGARRPAAAHATQLPLQVPELPLQALELLPFRAVVQHARGSPVKAIAPTAGHGSHRPP